MALAFICGFLGLCLGVLFSKRLVGTTVGFHGESFLILFGLIGAAAGGYGGYQMSLTEWHPANLPWAFLLGGGLAGALSGWVVYAAIAAVLKSQSGRAPEKVAKALDLAELGLTLLSGLAGAQLGYQFGMAGEPALGLGAVLGCLAGAVGALGIFAAISCVMKSPGEPPSKIMADEEYEDGFLDAVRWVPILCAAVAGYLGSQIALKGWSLGALSVGPVGGGILGFLAALIGLPLVFTGLVFVTQSITRLTLDHVDALMDDYGPVFGILLFVAAVVGADWGSQIPEKGWHLAELSLAPVSGGIAGFFMSGLAGFGAFLLISIVVKSKSAHPPEIVEEKLLGVGVGLVLLFAVAGAYCGYQWFAGP